MKEKKNKKIGWAFAIGLAVGIVLYQVIFKLLWPLVFD